MKSRNDLRFDRFGVHVLDPSDTFGFKTSYITYLHEAALNSLGPKGPGLALDIGCGSGRISHALRALDWEVVGVEPSIHLLTQSDIRQTGSHFVCGGLPLLPVPYHSVQLACVWSVLRSLKLMDKLHLAETLVRYVDKENGTLLVLENIQPGNSDFIEEEQLVKFFSERGMSLVSRHTIRRGRWIGMPFIRYGLVPDRLLRALARLELRYRVWSSSVSRRTYTNVLFTFKYL